MRSLETLAHLIAFRVGEADARVLKHEFGGSHAASQFTSLDNYEICVKPLVNGNPTEPFMARTVPSLVRRFGRRETIVRRSQGAVRNAAGRGRGQDRPLDGSLRNSGTKRKQNRRVILDSMTLKSGDAPKPEGVELQERDVRLLSGLFESRLMPLPHAAALYFEGRAEAAKKRSPETKSAGLIGERPRRAYDPCVLFLTRRGLLALADNGHLADYPQIGWAKIEKRARVSDLTLRHELAVMDVKSGAWRPRFPKRGGSRWLSSRHGRCCTNFEPILGEDATSL